MKTVLRFFLIFVIFTPHIILAQEEPCFVCDGNSVRGNKTSALGFGNTMEGDYSNVFGFNNRITGICTNIIGADNIASGDYSFVAGRNSSGLRNYSSAIGSWTYVDGLHSYAIGSFDTIIVNYAYLFGNNSRINSTSALVIGHYLEANANNAFIIGNGLNNSTRLSSTKSYSLTVGFNSNLPTLFVGTSNGLNTTGKVGIGNVTAPTAKLHIRADAADDATLRLEPGTGKVSRIYFSNTDDYYVQAATNQNMIFRTPTNKNFSFENGKIIASTLQISTGFGSGKLLQSDGSGNAVWTNPAWTISGINVYRSTGSVGIGTSTPGAQLDIADVGTAGSINLKVGNDAYLSDVDQTHTLGILSCTNINVGLLRLGLSGPELYGKENGNLGIGTTNPGSKLDVRGTTTLDYNQGNTTGNSLIVKSGADQLKIMDSEDNDYGIVGNEAENTYVKAYSSSGIEGAAIFLNKSGNVGIGITTPQKKLDINGDINFSGNLYKNNQPVNLSGYWASNGNNIYYVGGNVGIGISNPSNDYKLSVAGKILAEELQIQLVQDWYDNVFKEEYNLMDLNELESYVKQNNHLPDIPSETEVKENGIRVGEMNALLLKKVEELTLYIIEQQKMLECQHNEIENLKQLFTSKNNQ